MPGNPNPVREITGITTAADVVKGDFIAWALARNAQVMANAQDIRDRDMSGQLMVILKSTGAVFRLDTSDTTTADDGVSCIIDANGLRFKIVGGQFPAPPYVIGDLPYAPDAGSITMLPGNTTTTKKYLSQTGSGAASAAPAWVQIAQADVAGLTTASSPNFAGLSIGSGLYPVVGPYYYDQASAIRANSIGAKNFIGGVLSTDPSSTWVSTYLGGIGNAGSPSTFYGVSPIGSFAAIFASRSSDNTAGFNGIAEAVAVLHDNSSVARVTWGRYTIGSITAGATTAHHFNEESSIYNLGAAVATDPFAINTAGFSVGKRYSAGIGSGTPNSVSAAVDIIPNTGKWLKGIIIGDGALDTSADANPDVLAMPPVYSISWYNATTAKTWQLYAGSGANGNLNLVTGGTGAFAITGKLSLTNIATLTNIAAPASPSAGFVSWWADSTDLRFHDKNAAGTIGTTVVADAGASNNFLTAISAAGVISKAQPATTNLSDIGSFSLNTSGTIKTSNTTDSTALATGALQTLGGLAVTKTSFFGGVGHYLLTALNAATGAGFWLASITTGADRIFFGADAAIADFFRIYSVAAATNLLGYDLANNVLNVAPGAGKVGIGLATYTTTPDEMLHVGGNIKTTTAFKVGTNQVVGARDTGWTAMTGTPDESTSYATSTVTLPQLAGRVMALQTALTTHGLIGA